MKPVGSQFRVQTEEIQEAALFQGLLRFPKIERHSCEFKQGDAFLGVGAVGLGMLIELVAGVGGLLPELVRLLLVLRDGQAAVEAVLVQDVQLALDVGDLLREARRGRLLEALLLGERVAQRALEEVQDERVDPQARKVTREHSGDLILAVEARLPARALAAGAVVVDVLLLLDLADEEPLFVEVGADAAGHEAVEGELVALDGGVGGAAARHDVLHAVPHLAGHERRVRGRVPRPIPEELRLVERVLQHDVDGRDAQRRAPLRPHAGRSR